MQNLRDTLERHQAVIYFAAVALAGALALGAGGTASLEAAINPALAVMLYVTFLQVPVSELGKAFAHTRFLAALLTTNFVAIPLFVAGLTPWLPQDDVLKAGVLLVLLAPCIDYVVTFAHMGRADARLLLASTPVLLVVQMLLLPVYLGFFLGSEAGAFIQAGPFLHAFVWLIAVPLALAACTQWCARRSRCGVRASAALGMLPVPATALVLFLVIAAMTPQLGAAYGAALGTAPVYVAFAAGAPWIGWWVGRVWGLDAAAGRAVAFSGSTRNSLVVLPLALTIPGAVPVLPAVIVMQTLVELLSELAYIKLMPRLGGKAVYTASLSKR